MEPPTTNVNAHSNLNENWKQYEFCRKLLLEFRSEHHRDIAHYFYEPIDPIEFPGYLRGIKVPMDLSTMTRKLHDNEYPTAKMFAEDFMLMINNCFRYSVPGTPYNYAGVQLRNLFRARWKDLPPHDSDMNVDDDSYVEGDSDVEDDSWQAVPVASSSSKPPKAPSKKKALTSRKSAASRKATVSRRSARKAQSSSQQTVDCPNCGHKIKVSSQLVLS